MTWCVAGLVWMASGSVGAQEGRLVVPGDGTLALERLAPFEAEYEQMGQRMHVRFSRSDGPAAVWDMVMHMPTPSGGTGVDHVAHAAADFGFAYRRFGFGAFRDEYLEADVVGDTLSLRRFVRNAAPLSPTHVPVEHRMVDGTVLFWALGLLPLDVGNRYRFPTWNPTSEGVEVRESAVLEVRGRRSYVLGDWAVDAHLVVAATGGGQVEMLVSPHPPYLLEQTMVAADGTRTTVVEAISVSQPSGPADEAAIRDTGARFSEA
ncbi:MAG: hypothetical protein OEO23_05380, partial [Gemmatimonadota bacterium]|nr:hypothetical protein [Gemmatimonadota bacterium]